MEKTQNAEAVLRKLCDQLKAMRHSMFLHPSGGQHYSYLDRDEVYACVEQALAAAAPVADTELLPYLRQYRHNDGSDGFVFGYEKEGADRIVATLRAQLAAPDDAKDAARYRWLRDGKSVHGGYCGSAPYVVDPGRSRLYAIATLSSNALDLSVDADMLHTKAQRLHESNEIAERGLMPEGASSRDHDGPYVDALYKLAKEELSFTDERFDAAMLASQ